MKKRNRIFAYILVLAMIFTIIPMGTVAASAAGNPTLEMALVPNDGDAVVIENGTVTSSGVAKNGNFVITLSGIEIGNVLSTTLKYTPYLMTGAAAQDQHEATTKSISMTEDSFAVNTAAIPYTASSSGFYSLSFLLAGLETQVVSFELIPEGAEVRYNGVYYTEFHEGWQALAGAVSNAQGGAAVSKEIVLVSNVGTAIATESDPTLYRNSFYLNVDGATINANGFKIGSVYTGKNLTLNNIVSQVGIAYYVTSGSIMPKVTVLKASPDTKYTVGFMGDDLGIGEVSLGAIYANGFVDFEFLQGSMVAAKNVSVFTSGYTARDTGRGSVTLARTKDYPYAVAIESENGAGNAGERIRSFEFFDSLDAAVSAVERDGVTISGIGNDKNVVYVMAYWNNSEVHDVTSAPKTYNVEKLPEKVSDGSVKLRTFYRVTDGISSLFFVCTDAAVGYTAQYSNDRYHDDNIEAHSLANVFNSSSPSNAVLDIEYGPGNATASMGGVDYIQTTQHISEATVITAPGVYRLNDTGDAYDVRVSPAAAGEFTIKSSNSSSSIIIESGTQTVYSDNKISISGEVRDIEVVGTNNCYFNINIGNSDSPAELEKLHVHGWFFGTVSARNAEFKSLDIEIGNVKLMNSTVNAIGFTGTAIKNNSNLTIMDSCVMAGGAEAKTYIALLNESHGSCGIYHSQINVENSHQNSVGIGIENKLYGVIELGAEEVFSFIPGLGGYSQGQNNIDVTRGYGILAHDYNNYIYSVDINIFDDMAQQGSVGIYVTSQAALEILTERFDYFKEGGNEVNVKVGGTRGTALYCEEDPMLSISGNKNSVNFEADTAIYMKLTDDFKSFFNESFRFGMISCGTYKGKIDISGESLDYLIPSHNYAVLDEGTQKTVVCELYELQEYFKNDNASKGEFKLHCDMIGGLSEVFSLSGSLSDNFGYCRYNGNMPSLYEFATMLTFLVGDKFMGGGVNMPTPDFIPDLLANPLGLLAMPGQILMRNDAAPSDLIGADDSMRQVFERYFPHGIETIDFLSGFGGYELYDAMRAESYYSMVRNQTFYVNSDNNVIDFNGHTIFGLDAYCHDIELACLFNNVSIPEAALMALSGVLPGFTVLDGELMFKSTSQTATAGGIDTGAVLSVLVIDGEFNNGSKTEKAVDIYNTHGLGSVVLFAGKSELYGGEYNGIVINLFSDLDIYAGTYSGVAEFGMGLNYAGYTQIHGGEFYTSDLLEMLSGDDDDHPSGYNFAPIGTAQLNLGSNLEPVFTDKEIDVMKLFDENSSISLVKADGTSITDKDTIKNDYVCFNENDVLNVFAVSTIADYYADYDDAERAYVKVVENVVPPVNPPADNGGSSGGGSVKEGLLPGKAANKTYISKATNKFKDVTKDDYYAEAVGWALSKKITVGISEDEFGPNKDCSRGEIVTFLWRAVGCPEPKTTENPFKDIKEDDYFYKAVLWAYENKITIGTADDAFSPEKSCSNAHILTFLYRAMTGKIEVPENAEWYSEGMNWADENRLTEGTYSVSLDPNADAPRANILVYMYRYFNK